MIRSRTSLFLLTIATVLITAIAGSPTASSASFIRCSCQLCATSNVECRVTPTGKSLSCSDYYALFC
jgi:hypothetical protein